MDKVQDALSSVTGTATNGTSKTTPAPFEIVEQPAFAPRKLRIVCIGAGYSGLTLAHKLKHELKLDSQFDFTIYEKNADVGGTWWENRYPGAACDIPAREYNPNLPHCMT